MRDFRRALIQAAERAANDGEISQADVMRIRVATLRPRICRQLEEDCCAHLMASGQLPAGSQAGAIDWTAFLEFLRQLIQMILSLFL